MKDFLICTPVWGRHVSTCISYLLPTALAQGNIPSIYGRYRCVWYFYTDEEGKAQLTQSRVLQKLRDYVDIQFRSNKISDTALSNPSQYDICNSIYLDLIRQCAREDAVFLWLQPDLLLGSSTLKSIFSYLNSGYRVGWISPGFRISETLISSYVKILKVDEILDINHKLLAKLGIECMTAFEKARNFNGYQQEHAIVNCTLPEAVLQASWVAQPLAVDFSGLDERTLDFYGGTSIECSRIFTDVITPQEQISLIDSDDAIIMGVESKAWEERHEYFRRLPKFDSASPLDFALFPLYQRGFRINPACMPLIWKYSLTSEFFSVGSKAEADRFLHFFQTSKTIFNLLCVIGLDGVLQHVGEPSSVRLTSELRLLITNNLALLKGI